MDFSRIQKFLLHWVNISARLLFDEELTRLSQCYLSKVFLILHSSSFLLQYQVLDYENEELHIEALLS